MKATVEKYLKRINDNLGPAEVYHPFVVLEETPGEYIDSVATSLNAYAAKGYTLKAVYAGANGTRFVMERNPGALPE